MSEEKGAGIKEDTQASAAGVEVRAVAKFVHMAPRKLRLCARAICGRPAVEASNMLRFLNKRAAATMRKVLVSAMANAVNNNQMDENKLIVWRAYVDGGPVGKGWLPRSRGRASQLHNRTSHITIVVKEREAVR
ncbi:MAG: 50S ribosomal protein L22 [bacterium]|nr:50S ribosomal protein L22 [bacterium]